MISPTLEKPSSFIDRDAAAVDSANELVLEFCPDLIDVGVVNLVATERVEDLTVHCYSA